MPILVFLPNLDMGASEITNTRFRTLNVSSVLDLSAGDVVTFKVRQVSGSVTVKTIENGSELVLKRL